MYRIMSPPASAASQKDQVRQIRASSAHLPNRNSQPPRVWRSTEPRRKVSDMRKAKRTLSQVRSTLVSKQLGSRFQTIFAPAVASADGPSNFGVLQGDFHHAEHVLGWRKAGTTASERWV